MAKRKFDRVYDPDHDVTHIANNALGNVTLCGQTDWMGNKERPEHDTDRAVDCDTCLSTVALIRNHTI